MKVIIDSDPGTDDALAIMMALNSSDLRVQGITTVGGNATLGDTTRNTLRLLDYLEISGQPDGGDPGLPVSPGASRPLRGRYHYGYYYHGPAGLGVRLPSPRGRQHPVRATRFITDLVSTFPGEITLVALGPLTNVARALEAEPLLAGRIKEVVVMGGAVELPGNVTAHAEFNTYNDAVAADVVFASGVAVTLVPLDVCVRTSITRADLPWIAGGPRTARLGRRLLYSWFGGHPDRERYDLCDPLAMVAAVRPDLLRYEQAAVDVETDDPERLGKTTATYGDGDVRVAVDVDVEGAKRLMVDLLSAGP
jgi:inosine-uridine nucleoside N-ribohydrolase